MKNVFVLLLFVVLGAYEIHAQVPFKFNYQAVVRDNQGEIIANEFVALRFTLHSETANGPVVFQEIQNINTNEFGLVNVVIGDGATIQGTLDSPIWAVFPQFLQVEINTGNGYIDLGSNQLNSVPYALEADHVNLTLDELTDVNLGPPQDNEFLVYDVDHWKSAKVSEALTAGPGISISNNTISATGDLSTSDDANISLSNLLNTALNTDLVPALGSLISLGYGNRRFWQLYITSSIRMSYGGSIQLDEVDTYIRMPENEYDSDMSMGLEAGEPTAGYDNSFFGYYSGNAISTGIGNSCFGSNSGSDLTTGTNNCTFGVNTGYELASGDQNSYFGANAGNHGVNVNNNTYLGFRAGRDNTDGSNNVCVGSEAGISGLGSNNTAVGASTSAGGGGNNVVLGYSAGTSSANATENTYVGMNSGGGIGSSNVCVGFDAGGNQTTGSDCTFVGYSAESAAGNFTNATAIGYQASVTASNRVRIGNTAITQIGGQVAWSNLSDARLKKNIQPSRLGLEFINKLKPVTYNFIEGHDGILYTGFLAQDVDQVLTEMGEEFSGVTKPENDTDYYSIRYAEFVMPLVNAVQELSVENNDLKTELIELKASIINLQEQMDAFLSNQSTK